MATSDASSDDAEITLGLLNAVHRNEALTQRFIADELGVALGLVNAYLKRCVRKGYVKIKQAPRNRYAYYLTPKGFSEKSRLTAAYLSQGFKFFGIARKEIGEIYRVCETRNWCKLAIYGLSDLAEIAVLSARDANIDLVAIVDAKVTRTRYEGLPVVAALSDVAIDAVLLADTLDPQGAYEMIVDGFPDAQVMIPGLLNVSRRVPL